MRDVDLRLAHEAARQYDVVPRVALELDLPQVWPAPVDAVPAYGVAYELMMRLLAGGGLLAVVVHLVEAAVAEGAPVEAHIAFPRLVGGHDHLAHGGLVQAKLRPAAHALDQVIVDHRLKAGAYVD